MNNSETNTPHPEDAPDFSVEQSKKRKWGRGLATAVGASVLAGGLVLGTEAVLDHKDKERESGLIVEATGIGSATTEPEAPRTTPSTAVETEAPRTTPPTPAETEAPHLSPEQAAKDYSQEALLFAKTTINKLSDAEVETNPQGSENTTYQLSNIPDSEIKVMEPGQGRKRVVVRLNLGQRSLSVTGVEEYRNQGMKNQVQTTFKLDKDNPALKANPDAPVTYRDFAAAINGVEMDDVRSIVVFGQGINDQINGEFAPGKAPKFTSDGKKARTDIPTHEQIHAVTQSVQP